MTFAPDDPRHQDFEIQWWSDCANTFSEESKQLVYAHHMGLVQVTLGEKWPIFDLGHRRILDVGGGPSSILLKCVNVGAGSMVVDPGSYPAWTVDRYEHCGIQVHRERAEDWLFNQRARFTLRRATPYPDFDEAWCYNVLQHVVDPEAIVAGMRRAARTIRMFEWVNTGPSLGHPHTLVPELLDQWLDGKGEVISLNGENGCFGSAYHGVFRGWTGHRSTTLDAMSDAEPTPDPDAEEVVNPEDGTESEEEASE